jgi:hypothetical protein
VVFLIVVGGGAVLYFRYQQDKQQNTIRIETIGTPLLGGPFSLIDDNGKVRSEASERVEAPLAVTHCTSDSSFCAPSLSSPAHCFPPMLPSFHSA